MRAILLSLLVVAGSAPAWGKTDEGVSQRERRSFEERWRSHRSVSPALRPQLGTPANLLNRLPFEELDLAIVYQRADPERPPSLAAVPEATSEALLIPPVRPEIPASLVLIQPVSIAAPPAVVGISAPAPINPQGPLATSGPLPYDQFNLTYEGLRDRNTDCVLFHEPLVRSQRQPRAGHACDSARDLGATLPAFTTR